MRKIMVTASAFLFSMALCTGAFAQGGYGTAPGQTGEGAAQPPGQQEPTRVQPQQELGIQYSNGGFISSGQLIGQDIQTPDGERLGQIRGLLMDQETGQIGYAIVSAGGLLGIGRRDHLVPWNAMQIDPQEETYVLDTTPEEFRGSPTGREITTREEAEQIHEYYGVAPYWTEEDTLRMRPQQEPFPWEQPEGDIQERDPLTLPDNPSR
jgi:sporulation protein YlmC with PRC-barrel domain